MARSRVRTRCSTLAAAGTVAVTLGLSACSSSPGTAASTTTQSTATTTTAAPTTTTVAPAKPFLASLGKAIQVGSTVPGDGDVNPYGIALVPDSTGRLVAGDILVSNFNDKANVQGTGTTIVEVAKNGKLTEFARITSLPAGDRCPGGIGLSTALAVLPGGYVVVGSVPAAGPSGAPAPSFPNGCLIVLDSQGQVAATWTNDMINGPWDLTAAVSGSHAAIFVSNVFSRPAGGMTLPASGACTVARIDVDLSGGTPKMTGTTVIGTGFAWQVNKSTFVLGPTGLALGAGGTLYVAQTLGNHVTAIPQALTRTTPVTDLSGVITTGGYLNAPLGMVAAPNGDLLVTNGNDGNLVEVTPAGRQVAHMTLIPNGAGDLFGITMTADGHGIVFVDDGQNTVATALDGP